jgi:hypothetical protein|tara:strand:+ start:177 stop:377 length:201 start_codon:yes stop_codon:yes gene_type:complete
VAKKRRVPKDKPTGLAKKYLSGVKGSKRSELASVIREMDRLYKAGKRIPKSLMDKRIRLGRKSKTS